MSVQSGQVLSHYRLIEKIGEGGMGVVWKATDTVLDRTVAIKVLPADVSLNDSRREMFLAEARMASTVSHAHIAQVYEFGRQGDLDFIVMEFVEGRPLNRILTARPLSPRDVADYGQQVATAVARAHRKGLLHRDLKPGNILVTHDGEVKVVDFGLASLFEPRGSTMASRPSAFTEATTQTIDHTTGQVRGTLPYMSPEQVRGERLDARSDVFSLGIVLYEMTTGTRPFVGATTRDIAGAIEKARPTAVHDILPSVPLDLERIISKALAQRPSERFQTMEDLAVDLRRLGKDLESGSSPSYESLAGTAETIHRGWSARLAKRAGVWIAVAALALVLGVASLRLVTAPDHGIGVSSDGANDAIDPVPAGRIRQLTFTGAAYVPLWSPDGHSIAYYDGQEGKNKIMPARGGPPRTLEGSIGLGWNWMPDGSGVITHGLDPVSKTGAVFSVSLYGEATKVLATDSAFGDISPDGTTLAYARWAPLESEGIWLKKLSSGTERRIATTNGPGTAVYKPQWSPAADRVAYIRWNGRGHEFWIYDLEAGAERQVNTGSVLPGGHYEWAGDGKSVVCAGELGSVWSLWRVPVDEGRLTRLTPGSEQERHVSIAPDGKSLAFARTHDISRVLIVDPATGETKQPVQLTVGSRGAAFMADGQTIVFQALVNGRWQLWRAGLSGGDSPSPIVALPGISSYQPSVTAEGEVLYVRSSVREISAFGVEDWDRELWTSSPDGGQQRRIPTAGARVNAIAATPSRDGRILYSAESPSKHDAIYVLEPDTPPRLLFEDGEQESFTAFDWGGSNEVIVAVLGPNGKVLPHSIIGIDIRTGARRDVLEGHSRDLSEGEGPVKLVWALAVSPERQRLAMVARGEHAKMFGLYVLDLPTGRITRLRQFEKGDPPESLRWSPNGESLSTDLHQGQTDIFLLEDIDLPPRIPAGA